MKRSLTLLFLLSCFVSKAQTNFRFADSTAQWNVLTYQNGMWCNCISYHTTVHHIEGDTLLNGLQFQRVTGGQFVRKDSVGKVFYRNSVDSIESVLYDFSKIAGDTFSIGDVNNPHGLSIHCRVDSADSVSLNGWMRKRMYITYNSDSWKPDVWIYNLGSLHSHFLSPGIDHSIIDGDWYELLCFFEDSSQLYHDNKYGTCMEDTVIWMGVKDIDEDWFKVFVSADKTVTVQSEMPYDGTSNLQLYDLTGRLLLQKELTEQTTRINLGDVAAGVYVYSIQSDKQKIKTGKLLIE